MLGAISATRRRTAASAPIEPSTVSPTAWYDPSDLSTMFQDAAGTVPVSANNNPVRRINDKSGNGNHMTCASDAARPLYRTDGTHSWLEFDGTDDYLSAAFAIDSPIDRLSALRVISWEYPDYIYDGAAANVLSLYMAGGDPYLAMANGSAGPADGRTTGTDHVVTERFNGASSRLAFNSGAYVTGDAGTSTGAGGIRIGSFNGGALFGNFRLYGLIVRATATLTDSEISGLRLHLASKCAAVL